MRTLRMTERHVFWPKGARGFAVYTACLFFTFAVLPLEAFDPHSTAFVAGIGMLAVWRYGWGLVNLARALWYRKKVFPRWRAAVTGREDALLPKELYILVTIFRIDAKIVARAVRSLISEAARCGIPVTIVASIVEKQDEFMLRAIWESYNLPDTIALRIVRVHGTGKRDGLAAGFKTISRCMPADDAVTVVMDGDTILLPGTLRNTLPFFKQNLQLGALTTDEISTLDGSKTMRDWHSMRFAQRHNLMSSISLSRRVMTLTGRMSMFRAAIVTDPDFIAHMTGDHLVHWRLGRFKFLTGDDKSSLYWLMKQGYQQIYVPDVQVLTLEDPPHESFVKATTQLMFRWFGNMLRANGRILALGTDKMPFFVWWAFLDQRISMWTTMSGPVFATMLSIAYGPVYWAYYLVWVGFTRWVMSLTLLSARREISWRYPFLLYYSQLYGALVKSWVLFRLDIQSWTRQKTTLQRRLSPQEYSWNRWTSHLTHAAAMVALVCLIGLVSDVITFPESTWRLVAGLPGRLSGF